MSDVQTSQPRQDYIRHTHTRLSCMEVGGGLVFIESLYLIASDILEVNIAYQTGDPWVVGRISSLVFYRFYFPHSI